MEYIVIVKTLPGNKLLVASDVSYCCGLTQLLELLLLSWSRVGRGP